MNVLAAMRKTGANKLVRITGSLTGKSVFNPLTVLFNLLLSMTVKWHERSEIAIRKSGINYTIIRPSEIKNVEPVSLLTCKNISLELSHADSYYNESRLGYISLSDLADLCILSVNNNNLNNSTVIVSTKEKSHDIHHNWNELITKVVHLDLILYRFNY